MTDDLFPVPPPESYPDLPWPEATDGQRPCPVCGQPMESRIDMLDAFYGPVCEEEYWCPDGHYNYEWAYGATRVHVGDRVWIGSDKFARDEIARAIEEEKAKVTQ